MHETSYHDQHGQWQTCSTYVMFVVHNSAELISCELHLQVWRIFLNSDLYKANKRMFHFKFYKVLTVAEILLHTPYYTLYTHSLWNCKWWVYTEECVNDKCIPKSVIIITFNGMC